MNVCLINDSFPPLIDGVSNAVVNYAEIINGGGDRAEVVTPFYPNTDDSHFTFPVTRYPSLDTEKLVGYRAGMPYSNQLMKTLESRSFDVIHSHCPITSTVLGRALRDRTGAPLVLTYHTKFDIDIANVIRSRLLQKAGVYLLIRNIEACDEIWTVSRGAGENLRSLGYAGDVIVMPNGVDVPRGRLPDAAAAEALKDADLPENVPVYLYVGRMMWYKGLKITLDALHRLAADGKNFRMAFIGGGSDFEEIRTYSHRLELDDRVIFTGPIYERETIRAWYSRADLFLFPSTFDTNGLVVREAAASGLASVLIRNSCAAENVTDGQNGFLIEENAASMALQLATLMGNRELTRRVGENAARELYLSWTDAVTQARHRYEWIIDNHERTIKNDSREKLTAEFFEAMDDLRNGYELLRSRQAAARTRMMNELSLGQKTMENGKEHVQEQLKEIGQFFDRFM